jgi:hypothetical protein
MAEAEGRGRPGPRDVSFPPVPNGVDYLVSVVELLSREKGDPSARDLKYAVLHLQAASEVLLKARLQIEHWTLVVKDAAKTKKHKHQDGDFESPTHAEAVRRLVDVVGIDISEEDRKALLGLAKTRNSLQHWGLTESAPAVEARAAAVLDFLIRFLDDHLLTELAADQLADIDDDMLRVREGLTGIKAYVKSRMSRLRGELKEVAERTVQCPDCTQFALVVDGVENKCHICPRLWDFDELAQSYASEVLSFSWHDLTEGASDPTVECPDCGTETLILGALTAAQPDRYVNLCFNCAEVFDKLESCMRCTRLYVPDEDETICANCWRDLIESD